MIKDTNPKLQGQGMGAGFTPVPSCELPKCLINVDDKGVTHLIKILNYDRVAEIYRGETFGASIECHSFSLLRSGVFLVNIFWLDPKDPLYFVNPREVPIKY